MYEIVALILCLGIIAVVLAVAIAPNFISNSPQKSGRAREMQNLAQSLGLNYLAEENRTLKQKLFDYTRKTNIITGKYKDKEILIYDYKTITNYKFENNQPHFHGNDPKKFTYVNGSYLKSNLSLENIKNILDGSVDKDEFVSKTKKWSLNTGVFTILIVLIICIDFISFSFLKEEINMFLLLAGLVVFSIVMLYVSYLISKKTYEDTPIR